MPESSFDAPGAAPEYRRYRAPQADGASLVDPPWRELASLADANRQRLEASDWSIAGTPVSEFAHDARRQLIAAAHDYTSQFCDVSQPEMEPPALILSGHQPELFHPGVWFKNFALDALARETGGVGIHLLIDSDLCRQVSVRTPTGPVDAPRIESVGYDAAAADMPYEERPVLHPALLESFGSRIAEALTGLVDAPLSAAMTPDLVEAARETGNLGQTLSRARRRVEQRWGGQTTSSSGSSTQTLELPFSQLCDSAPFHYFVGALLHDLPGLHAAYNGALADYRLAHRLRTPAQPTPDLQHRDRPEEGGWWETPLWVWTTSDPERRPLYARRHLSDLQLSNLAGTTWTVGPAVGDDEELAEGLADLRAQGVKIRSRALITTLYSRLVLGDLFLHGIGGAKYDQVTDDFARRLWGVTPPPHATLSATLRLPIDYAAADPSEEPRLRQGLRELRYHPETFLDDVDSATARLIARKREAIADRSGDRKLRHQTIEEVNAALQPQLDLHRRTLAHERAALAERLHATAILGSREHSFCLYPEAWLAEAMHGLLRRS